MSAEELHDLIRQLRVELEWAVRTGIAPPAPPAPPPLAVADDEEPKARHEAPPVDASPREPPRESSRPTPQGQGHVERPSAPSPPAAAHKRAAHPHRPWEAYLPGPPDPGGLASPAEPPSAEVSLANRLQAAGGLEEVREILGPCVRCKLHKLGRTQIVFGVGPADAEIMFVGEGPGADEDRIGEPFVGAAGQLLTRIIEGGMGLRRQDVYIANIVKCRPPRNRNPEPDEVEQCEPFLQAQIRVVRPRVLVALGKYAAQTLLRDTTPITRLRGKWQEYEGIPLMPTFHPAYLLRNPAEKRPVWEDIQNVLKFLGRPIPGRG